MKMLSSEAALNYWDTRHREYDELRSGGHIGTDRQTNEAFYTVRLGQLVRLAGLRVSEQQPAFALDAGCGKGMFAAGLARCGWTVDAIDASPTAIETARDLGVPVRWTVARLDEWRPSYGYDLVYAVDVLFHLVVDSLWETSLRNLAGLVRPGGRLVLTDEPVLRRRTLGDYIVHRPLSEYLRVLEPHQLEATEFCRYDFRESQLGFHVFSRRG